MSYINEDIVLAAALVINRSRDGPAFVFHYPAHVQPIGEYADPPDIADLDDILLERLSQPASQQAAGHAQRTRANDDHFLTESGTQIVPWEHVAGFPTNDLASILTPARPYHKKLFQLSLDPVLCICCPVHVPESGRWKKTKTAERAKSRLADDQSVPNDSDLDPARTIETRDGDAGRKDETEEQKRSSMTMFNLVFFINPKHKHGELREIVNTIHTHIIKKMNKAYKYSQQHSDFVWKESKRILAAKDKGREEKQRMSELWKDIVQHSSLAASVRDIYEAVTQNKIASVHLETAAGIISPSVQIPIPYHVADLPPEDDKDQVGLWLTTANTFLTQEALDEPGFLDRTFALLLMDEPKRVAAELTMAIDRDAQTTSALVEFLRHSKPTLSFHQVAQSFPNTFTPSQVRRYAHHFISWRRGIAITPLHARDTYITSPNCDLSQLPQASQQWSKLFPVAPALPAFLAELSNAPRSYKSFCPTKQYRQTYLHMLAWLMRGGWVTQLSTFAYVVVWPEILYEVDYEMEAEELLVAGDKASPLTRDQPSSDAVKSPSSNPSVGGTGAEPFHSPSRTVSHDPLSPVSNTSSPLDSAPSPYSSSSLLRKSPSPTDTFAVQTAEKARVARLTAKATEQAAEKATQHARRVPPRATKHPSTNDSSHLSHLQPYIIYDPRKATGRESRYLSAIATRFDDAKLRDAWANFGKYFDGRTAMERVALLEDMKRKEIWGLLSGMSEWLLCVRHW